MHIRADFECDRSFASLGNESQLFIDLSFRPFQVGVAHDVVGLDVFDESLQELAHTSVYSELGEGSVSGPLVGAYNLVAFDPFACVGECGYSNECTGAVA